MVSREKKQTNFLQIDYYNNKTNNSNNNRHTGYIWSKICFVLLLRHVV